MLYAPDEGDAMRVWSSVVAYEDVDLQHDEEHGECDIDEVSDLLCAHGLMYKGSKTVDHISAVFANRNTNEITTATMMLVCEHTVGRPYRRESRIHANMQQSRCSKKPPCRVMAVRGYRDESER